MRSARVRASDVVKSRRVQPAQRPQDRGKFERLTLHTIGYESSDIGQVLAALHAHDIETVIDVRELPLSRKPGFSKKALAIHLARHGVRYIHIRALGCPRAIRHRYRTDGDWVRYEQEFLEHLVMQQDALARLADITSASKSALLCFEAHPDFCHRHIVAAAVARIAHTPVLHISTRCAGRKIRAESIK